MKPPRKRSKNSTEDSPQTPKKGQSQKLPPKRSIDDILAWTSLEEWVEEAEGNLNKWNAKQDEFACRALYKGEKMDENKENTWILLDSNNEVAGALQFWTERASDRLHVIAMSPDDDNTDIMYLSMIHGWEKGQGHKLMCAFLKKVLSTDCRYVQLLIKRYDNEFLEGFYGRFGFKRVMDKTARRPGPIIHQGYLLMSLDLPSSPALPNMLLENVFE